MPVTIRIEGLDATALTADEHAHLTEHIHRYLQTGFDAHPERVVIEGTD